MRHLVRMASYSSETNMHARNLAIVWAPNLLRLANISHIHQHASSNSWLYFHQHLFLHALIHSFIHQSICMLRSKDIEASGFNGTAAFMEVRVQSIVVEFILTHVPQLFPEHGNTMMMIVLVCKLHSNSEATPYHWLTPFYSGVSAERRKSLPSPCAESNQEEGFFKPSSTLPVPNFGNISPGDGPLPIRPYHAIIEGTDKWVDAFIYLTGSFFSYRGHNYQLAHPLEAWMKQAFWEPYLVI